MPTRCFRGLGRAIDALRTREWSGTAETRVGDHCTQRCYALHSRDMAASGGETGSTMVTLRDITDRVQAEARQRLVSRMLWLLNSTDDTTDLLQNLLRCIQDFAGLRGGRLSRAGRSRLSLLPGQRDSRRSL